jgi:hypothetical protein
VAGSHFGYDIYYLYDLRKECNCSKNSHKLLLLKKTQFGEQADSRNSDSQMKILIHWKAPKESKSVK